jgi:hypothetical protein
MKKPNLKLKKRDVGKLNPKSDVKPPKLVADLYADLRDRRLLPLVALLLVAIFAVPFLLGDEEKETPPPPVPIAGGKTSPASFSVVPADPGLREIGKRLGHRKVRDPFRVPDGGRTDSRAPAGEPQEEPGGEVEPPAPVEPPAVEQTTNIVVQSDVTEFGVNLVSGFVGEFEKEQPHVPEMTPLPNKQNPVVTFIGLNSERDGAIFLLSSDVTAYYGKGTCVDDKQSCQMLELKPGKSATLAVGFGETRFKVQLKGIVAKVRTYTEKTDTVSRGG